MKAKMKGKGRKRRKRRKKKKGKEGPFLKCICMFSCNITITPQGRYCCQFYLTDKETEAQRD